MDNFERISSNSRPDVEVFRRKRKFIPHIRRSLSIMLSSLQGSGVVIELKNDTEIYGVIDEVDSYMNIFLTDVREIKPSGATNDFELLQVLGTSIRYVHIPDSINCAAHLSTYIKGIDRLQKAVPTIGRDTAAKKARLSAIDTDTYDEPTNIYLDK